MIKLSLLIPFDRHAAIYSLSGLSAKRYTGDTERLAGSAPFFVLSQVSSEFHVMTYVVFANSTCTCAREGSERVREEDLWGGSRAALVSEGEMRRRPVSCTSLSPREERHTPPDGSG